MTTSFLKGGIPPVNYILVYSFMAMCAEGDRSPRWASMSSHCHTLSVILLEVEVRPSAGLPAPERFPPWVGLGFFMGLAC
jgi:hypothetical protein